MVGANAADTGKHAHTHAILAAIFQISRSTLPFDSQSPDILILSIIRGLAKTLCPAFCVCYIKPIYIKGQSKGFEVEVYMGHRPIQSPNQ